MEEAGCSPGLVAALQRRTVRAAALSPLLVVSARGGDGDVPDPEYRDLAAHGNYDRAGRLDLEGMEAVMTEDYRAKVARDLLFSFYTTQIFALAGLREQTHEWFHHMVDSGFRNFPWLTRDPWLSPYRDDPEFRSLFEEVQEAWVRSAGDGIADAKPS